MAAQPNQQHTGPGCRVCAPYFDRFMDTAHLGLRSLLTGYGSLTHHDEPDDQDVPMLMASKMRQLAQVGKRLDWIARAADRVIEYPDLYPDSARELTDLDGQAHACGCRAIDIVYPGAGPTQNILEVVGNWWNPPSELTPYDKITQTKARFTTLMLNLHQVAVDCPHHAF